MGMTTPFPEPDSPELGRFAVRSEAEIVSLLRALQARQVPLNAFVDAGSSFDVVALLQVDEAARELVFARPVDEALSDRLLAAPLVTFVGFVDLIKVQFAASGVRAAGKDASTFAVPIPAQLTCLRRRRAERVRSKVGRGAVCRIPLPGGTGEWEALRVLDLGIGGIAVLDLPERFEPIVGEEIDDCRLDLPGVGGAVVNLRVRHTGPQPGDQTGRCCGCELVHVSPSVRSMLVRFINDRLAVAA